MSRTSENQRPMHTFTFEAKQIHVESSDSSEILFSSADVAQALDIKDIKTTFRGFPANEIVFRDVETAGGTQSARFLTEAGVFRLIFRSRKPNAEAFQTWIFAEVLPSLRRTGRYELPGAALPSAPQPGGLSALRIDRTHLPEPGKMVRFRPEAGRPQHVLPLPDVASVAGLLVLSGSTPEQATALVQAAAASDDYEATGHLTACYGEIQRARNAAALARLLRKYAQGRLEGHISDQQLSTVLGYVVRRAHGLAAESLESLAAVERLRGEV